MEGNQSLINISSNYFHRFEVWAWSQTKIEVPVYIFHSVLVISLRCSCFIHFEVSNFDYQPPPPVLVANHTAALFVLQELWLVRVGGHGKSDDVVNTKLNDLEKIIYNHGELHSQTTVVKVWSGFMLQYVTFRERWSISYDIIWLYSTYTRLNMGSCSMLDLPGRQKH